jgi:hypothetical protein
MHLHSVYPSMYSVQLCFAWLRMSRSVRIIRGVISVKVVPHCRNNCVRMDATNTGIPEIAKHNNTAAILLAQNE